MLIAISGAQGSGKTTILNKIQQLGFNVVERKTARSILTEWNTTLDKVYRDPGTAVKFQNEILKRKAIDETEALASKDLWFTERSYSDLFTYAVSTVGRYNEHDKWLNEYFEKCKTLNQQYGAIVYMHGGFKADLKDGVRGFNQHYIELIDRTLANVTHKMTYNEILLETKPQVIYTAGAQGYSLSDMNSADVRARYVLEQALSLWVESRLPRYSNAQSR